MIKLSKLRKYNIILGILTGFILAQIVMAEGYASIVYNQQNNQFLDDDLLAVYATYIKAAGFIVFIVTISIFNTKRFKKINLDKLGVYLLLVSLASIIATIEGIMILGRITISLIPDFELFMSSNYFFSMNFIFIAAMAALAIFVTTFILLVNRKVKYIKYLTKEVKVIKEEGFGKTIKVAGGDELAELCRSINDMSVELGQKIENEKKIENDKNELITNISHDLKTPLTSIIGYLDILNHKDLNEEDKEEYIKIAYNKSLRLKSLVNELFEYTKLAGNDIKFEKEKVNLSLLLNQAVGESIINFDEKNIDVVLDNPYKEIFCNMDSTQMLRVFENLIKNAEKYSDNDSVFKVALKVNKGNILISFTNKCEELNGENVENLFEKFYRNDKSRSKEGSGLGLPITKRIVELHDGTIWAENNDDNITFNIRLKKV
ncbi:MAG: HAMP domain-containing sensor histidine kinase [Clostridium sp.]|nr:HAMP domain-containing sensor histidine kinase [Clostridium sp.]